MQFVVTGGSSGVGAALVSRLVGAGHGVINLDVQAPIEPVEGADYRSLDLSDPAAIAAAVNDLPEQIDGLANVAGIARAPDPQLVLAVNFLGARLLAELLTPRIRQLGTVVSVSSVAGWDWQTRWDRISPLVLTESFEEGAQWCCEHEAAIARDPYTFSKRCLSAWTARRAQTFQHTGVRVNCISPAAIDTPLHPQFTELMGKDHSDWTIAQVGRMATPNDIAEVLDMLLTAETAWLNGADLPVDGGYAAGTASGWIDFNESPAMKAIRAKKGGG